MLIPRTVKKKLEKIYYAPENSGAFGGVNQLYIAARKVIPQLDKDTVKTFLLTQDTYTLHKPYRSRFPRRKVLARHIDQVSICIVIFDIKYSEKSFFLL